MIRGVKNGPAPKWVQDKLKSVGMKSISALVDATNLISPRIAAGHCMCSTPTSCRAVFAPAWPRDGEQVLALDDVTYTLDAQTVVIADDSHALGIAGVMGGKDSGSYDTTVNVFLESAYFDPVRASRARAASRASFPTRATASSAASIRNSCCPGWNWRPG